MPISDKSQRRQSSKILCSVSSEHAESAKMLIASGNFTSAIGLVRLQYETMVRAMWLLYAANDLSISKLMSEFIEDNVKKANNIPMLSEMLIKLEGKAPKEAMDLLLEFKEYSWKPLSSFIHGGIHAIHRHSKGYPLPLLTQVLKASNGVSIMTGMLLIILSEDPFQKGKIPKIQHQFAECLPNVVNQ